MRILLFFILFFSCGARPLQASPLSFQSHEHQIRLMELYTSEGCSSCPPADAWFSKLKMHPGLWKKFVPVVFHVTYWDNLGWKDRWASRVFDQRQKDYVQAWKGNALVTPGVVLDGKDWQQAYQTDLSSLPEIPAAGVLTVKALDEKEYLAEFKPLKEPSGPLELQAVLLGFQIQTQVQAGENAGKILKHDFVVLYHTRKALKAGALQQTAAVIFPSRERWPEVKQFGAAFWVMDPSQGIPLQAAGGFLPSLLKKSNSD